MSPVSPAATAIPVRPTEAPAPAQPDSPGGRGRSVGHLAKQAVAAARESGVDLPKNAQGLAASQIARGIDPADVFAAVAEEPPLPVPPETEPPAEPTATVDPAADGAEPVQADAPGDETAAPAVSPEDPAETVAAAPSADDAAPEAPAPADTSATDAGTFSAGSAYATALQIITTQVTVSTVGAAAALPMLDSGPASTDG